ncbi:MAG: hypothetical protein CMP48_09365 [Rickettsiales bacterium]|nr:hypothetical protein [Rickettsiales bacterium]
MNKINNESEKSTLGDLDALSALKEKMEEAASKPAKKAPAKKAEEPKAEEADSAETEESKDSE